MNKLSTLCLSVWLVLGSITGLLLGQYQAGILHPMFIPLLLLVLVALALVLLTLLIVTRRLVRGDQWRNTIQACQTRWVSETRRKPNEFDMPESFVDIETSETSIRIGSTDDPPSS